MASQAAINEALLSPDHLRSKLGGRTARGGAIVASAQVVRMFIQLATTFVLARILAPSDFGLIAIGYTIMGFINLFMDLSLTSVTVQIEKLEQRTASGLLYANVALSTSIVALVALTSPLLAMAFHDPRVTPVAIGLALSAPLGALGSQHYAILVRNMRWMLIQSCAIGAMAFGSIVAVLVAWLFNAGYWALVIQAIASAGAGTVISWLTCKWRPSLVDDWSGTFKALRTSLHLSGNTILSYIHRQTDNILIGWRWGVVELGFYARAYSLLMMPLLITGQLQSVTLPALSRLQNDPQRWRGAYLESLMVVTAIGGCIGALMFGGAVPIIDFILGPHWGQSEGIFSSLVLAMLVATPMSTVSWIYISLGQTDRMLKWAVTGVIIYVSSFVIGLPYGAQGVATAYGCAQLLAFLPCLWWATRRSPATLIDVLKTVLPIMAITLVVGVSLRFVTAAIDSMLLDFVAIAAAGLIYLCLVFIVASVWPPHRRFFERAMGMRAKLVGMLQRAPQ